MLLNKNIKKSHNFHLIKVESTDRRLSFQGTVSDFNYHLGTVSFKIITLKFSLKVEAAEYILSRNV